MTAASDPSAETVVDNPTLAAGDAWSALGSAMSRRRLRWPHGGWLRAVNDVTLTQVEALGPAGMDGGTWAGGEQRNIWRGQALIEVRANAELCHRHARIR